MLTNWFNLERKKRNGHKRKSVSKSLIKRGGEDLKERFIVTIWTAVLRHEEVPDATAVRYITMHQPWCFPATIAKLTETAAAWNLMCFSIGYTFLPYDRGQRESYRRTTINIKKRKPQREPRGYFPKIANETARVFRKGLHDRQHSFTRSEYSGNNNRNVFCKNRNTAMARRELRVKQKRKFVLPERPATNV